MPTALEPRRAMDDFLLSLEGVRKPNTVIFYRSSLRQFVTWCEQSDLPISSINLNRCEAYLRARREMGSSRTTIYHDATCLRKFLDYCRRQGWLRANPLRRPPSDGGLRISKPRPQVGFVPSREQVDQLLRSVKPRWNPAHNPSARLAGERDRDWRARHDFCVILLLAETGCRLGEACSLLLADVNEKNPQWTGHATATFRDTKTGQDRTVPVSPDWVKAYRAYLAVRYPSKLPHVFVTSCDRPLTAHWFGAKFADYVRYAGLPAELTAQTLRRRQASNYARKGQIKAGSELLGHSPTTLLRHYARMSEEDLITAWRAESEYEPVKRGRRVF